MTVNELDNIQSHILVVDDNREIHEDFKSILIENEVQQKSDAELDDLLSDIFATSKHQNSNLDIVIDSAYQGEEALQKVIQSEAKNKPYDLIFMDVRMPPGWDGIETIHHIWEQFPHIEIVICTAYSDFSWHEVQEALGISHRLLILKKPFDSMEVKQLVLSLTMKSTYYKKYENHIEELERVVKQRTAGLKEAKINAELANKAKSTFLSNMSHELRTPLNGVLGYAELLSRDNLVAEQVFKIDTIQRCGNHLLELINNILDLSKIESGQVDKKLTTFNLNEVISDVAQMLQPKLQRKQLYLKIKNNENITSLVISDEKKIRQILINLISNAIDFTKKGGITLNIELLMQDTIEQQIKFSVLDTGQGISKQDIDHIFHPFKQAESNTTGSGTGLGLAISKSFIELLGGKLEVISQLDNGSCFFFTLNMPIDGEVEEVKEFPQLATKVIGIKEDKHPKILVVSGLDITLGVLAGILKKVGFDVIQATNAEQALEKLAQIEIDLVISDVKMQPVSGLILLQKIKQQIKLPVIMSSASVLGKDEQDYLVAGADGFIAKPIEWEKFFVLITRLLGIEYIYEQNKSVLITELNLEEIDQQFNNLLESKKILFRDEIDNGNLKKIRENAKELTEKALGAYIIKLAMAYDLAGLKELFTKNN